MSEHIVSYGNIEVRVKDNLVTISFDCDFGPIAFSFNSEKLSAKLSMIVSQTLDQIYRDEPDALNTIAKDTKLPVNDIRKILESYILKSHRTIPASAIEKFMQGRNLTLEGAVQQVIENLPSGIVLMLTHLTTATLLTTTDYTNESNSKTLLIDDECRQLFYTKLKDSINKLWERAYENRD